MSETISALDPTFSANRPNGAAEDPSTRIPAQPTAQPATHPALLCLAILLGRQAAAEAFDATDVATAADRPKVY